MKLYINTADRGKIIVGLGKKRFRSLAKKGASQRLLPFIDEVLAKEGATFAQITEIEVNCGPGSFTGLRVGVSVANAIAWALGIKVNGKDVKKGQMVDIKYS